MSRQQLLDEKIKKAAAIQAFRESDAWKLLMEPLQEELEGLKSAYDCKTLQEIATLKGVHLGLSFIPRLITGIEREGQLAKEKILKQQEKESEIVDSTDL